MKITLQSKEKAFTELINVEFIDVDVKENVLRIGFNNTNHICKVNLEKCIGYIIESEEK